MSWLLRDGLAEECEPSHVRTPCSTLGPAACYYAGNDNITACLQHVDCGARTVAWMKGKTSSPKERPFFYVFLYLLELDFLVVVLVQSLFPLLCSTRGPTANRQPVA